MAERISTGKDGAQYTWYPTTDLYCAICQCALDITPQCRGCINFQFEYILPDPLERGEYFYTHKKECARKLDALAMKFGWHGINYVLGFDRTMEHHYGKLSQYLKKTMPDGAYATLYSQWLPPQPPKVAKKKSHALEQKDMPQESLTETVQSVVSLPQRLVKIQERTLTLRFQILKRDNYRCRLCGVAAKDGDHVRLEVDHITPRSQGGTDDPINLWTLCFACNRGKGVHAL